MRRFAGCLLGLLWLVFCASRAEASDVLRPCRVPGLKHEVLCGQVKRALNPAEPSGVQIDIHYVLVPAVARHKWPDPVFFLAGGPGQSAISLAPAVMPLFMRLNQRRDIVFIDQRGTGRSAPLFCEDSRHESVAQQADPEWRFGRLMSCLDSLKALPYGDVRYFTTTLAMQDADAVREQLGASHVNLIGGSYGSRAALEFQRLFPQVVRRSVLDGVAPPDMVLPASISSDAQAVFDAMLSACEDEPACTQAHPALRAEWETLMVSLPRQVTVSHPLTGMPESFMLTRDELLGWLRAPLYSPALTAALPQAIGDAVQGRWEGLAGLSSMLSGRKSAEVAAGMHFSVICSEDFPRLGLARDKPGIDFGSEWEQHYRRICNSWPRGQVLPAFYRVAKSASPVLVLSGGLDPVTPRRHGDRVTRALGAKALHVQVPHAGHGVMGIGCMREVIYRFIDAVDDAGALAINASCAKRIPRPPAFQPLTLRPQGKK